MTPDEAQLLQVIGLRYLEDAEKFSIAIFFYGTSSPSQMIAYLIFIYESGVYVLLFWVSVVIFMSVALFKK